MKINALKLNHSEELKRKALSKAKKLKIEKLRLREKIIERNETIEILNDDRDTLENTLHLKLTEEESKIETIFRECSQNNMCK